MLASNRDEADELLEEAVRTQSRVEVCDTVILPALQLARGRSRSRRIARLPKRLAVFEHIEQWADEFVHAAGRAARAAGQPDSRPLSARIVLCVAAEDQADQIAPSCWSPLLLEQGMKARIARSDLAEEARPDAVVISALPPDAGHGGPAQPARRCASVARRPDPRGPVERGRRARAGASAPRGRGGVRGVHELRRMHRVAGNSVR